MWAPLTRTIRVVIELWWGHMSGWTENPPNKFETWSVLSCTPRTAPGLCLLTTPSLKLTVPSNSIQEWFSDACPNHHLQSEHKVVTLLVSRCPTGQFTLRQKSLYFVISRPFSSKSLKNLKDDSGIHPGHLWIWHLIRLISVMFAFQTEIAWV